MTQYLVVLSIAGSDPSGGAGIQADLKTLSALGVYAASVITALTVQNTCGVSGVVCVEPEVVEAQIRAVVSDLRPSVIKVGMVGSQAVLEAIVRTLRDVACGVPLIVDPILKSSSGADLMEPAAQAYFCCHFLPLVTLLTPNLSETAALTGLPVESAADVRRAAARLLDMGPEAVLIKGGHACGPQKQDVLFWHATDGSLQYAAFEAPAVATRNTHGTGCTLSSAIAAYRARGLSWPEAVAGAKRYITQALQAGADVAIGQGTGPLNHFFSPQPLIKQNVMTPIQFITHYTERYSYLDSARMALEGGCRWIQLRMKNVDDAVVEHTARELLPMCRRAGAVLILDDRVELALRLGADGVHLGHNDMPLDRARAMSRAGFIIGGTANTFDDIRRLAEQGADYIGCGPYRFTTTKQKLSPVLGLEGYGRLLQQMREAQIHVPLVAIGGITEADIPALLQTGVQGIALSGSILRDDNPAEAMRRVCRLCEGGADS